VYGAACMCSVNTVYVCVGLCVCVRVKNIGVAYVWGCVCHTHTHTHTHTATPFVPTSPRNCVAHTHRCGVRLCVCASITWAIHVCGVARVGLSSI